MDQRERLDNFEESLRAAMDGHQSRIWTAIIGTVVEYFPSGQYAGTATIQPAIQARITAKDGTKSWQSMAALPNVPVVYLGGGGFVATFPIQPGDEALVVFNSRCIAAWFQNGAGDGGQIQAEPRMHDLSDGIAIIGPRSLARALTNVSTDTVQLRSLDGSTYYEIADGQVCNIVAPGGVNINGVQIDSSGNITTPGKVTATGEGTFNNIEVSQHVHTGVMPGGGTTGPPEG